VKKLKVYGWIGWRNECPLAPNGSMQTREIVSARSKGEAAKLAGKSGPWRTWDLCETRNYDEMLQARSEPGMIFWHPLHERPVQWRRADVLK
jgi:hypothetical protein